MEYSYNLDAVEQRSAAPSMTDWACLQTLLFAGKNSGPKDLFAYPDFRSCLTHPSLWFQRTGGSEVRPLGVQSDQFSSDKSS